MAPTCLRLNTLLQRRESFQVTVACVSSLNWSVPVFAPSSTLNVWHLSFMPFLCVVAHRIYSCWYNGAGAPVSGDF